MTVKNLAASVQARLQNRARETKRPFQELLQYFAMERFLYRLSKSPHRSRFVLKGALMLHVWDAPLARAAVLERERGSFIRRSKYLSKPVLDLLVLFPMGERSCLECACHDRVAARGRSGPPASWLAGPVRDVLEPELDIPHHIPQPNHLFQRGLRDIR